MDIGFKRDLKKNLEASLENLVHEVEIKEYRSTLPYGRPMHLKPVRSSMDILKSKKREIPPVHLEITKRYGIMKKEMELMKEDIKKRVHLEKIKNAYINERINLQTKNTIPDYQKYSKARDLRNSIGKIKKFMSALEERLEKRLKNIQTSIKSLEKTKKNYESLLKIKSNKQSSKESIELKDGIILCEQIMKRANEKIHSYSNAAWKNILPKDSVKMQRSEKLHEFRMERSK